MNYDRKFKQMQNFLVAKLGAVLLILVLATACGTSITVDETSVEITVPLSESAINRLLRLSFVDQDDDRLFDDITSIDMQPGLIRVFGTYEHSDGSTVPGSVDLTMSAKDGALAAEITAVDIAGLDVDHPRVTRINDVMAKVFSEEASDNDQAEIVSVDITEDGMEITVRMPRQ